MVYNEFIRTIIDNVSSERQNYKITNLRSKYALVYENGKYIKVLREPATSSFIYNRRKTKQKKCATFLTR